MRSAPRSSPAASRAGRGRARDRLGRRAAPPAPQPPRPSTCSSTALATRYTEGYVAGVPPLRAALQASSSRATPPPTSSAGCGWRAASRRSCGTTRRGTTLATRQVRLAARPAPSPFLPIALDLSRRRARARGRVRRRGGADRGGERDHGGDGQRRRCCTRASCSPRGGAGDTGPRRCSSTASADAIARGEGRAVVGATTRARCSATVSADYQAALAAAGAACEHDDLGSRRAGRWSSWSRPPRAATSRDVAAAALERSAERTRASGTDWALGIEARSRALLSDGPEADELYREAIERLGRSRIAVQLARAHLVYGEWLRRENRRVDAREQLRAAHDMFRRMGAEALRRTGPPRAAGDG